MRISDWSSDVCSSDLVRGGDREHIGGQLGRALQPLARPIAEQPVVIEIGRHRPGECLPVPDVAERDGARRLLLETVIGVDRSEEHTSELQSLMRISYAVFCLKKKTFHADY